MVGRGVANSAGRIRKNNAIEAFRNAFACSIAQADRPKLARFLYSVHTHQNMGFGEISVSANTPLADRSLADIGPSRRYHRGNARRSAKEVWLLS